MANRNHVLSSITDDDTDDDNCSISTRKSCSRCSKVKETEKTEKKTYGLLFLKWRGRAGVTHKAF